MQDRSFGVTTLAFSSVMVGLYCQYAAIALILTGSVFTAAGSFQAGLALITGAVFFGLTFAAYFVAYGLWTRKHWSWAGTVVLFATFIVANAALSVLSANPINTLVPAIGGGLALWFLARPAIKAELLGREVPVAIKVPPGESMEAAKPIG